jgi:hypothetical protein
MLLVAVAAVAVLGVGAGIVSAHTLKAVRAANANKAVTREVCRSFVNDPDLGTCVDWTSGPCRRVSAHRIRCQMTHRFEHEDGSEIRCRQAQEWFIPDDGGALQARPVLGSSQCRVVRGPDPVIP